MRRSASGDSPYVRTLGRRRAASSASRARRPASSAQVTRKPPGRCAPANASNAAATASAVAVVVEVVRLDVGHDGDVGPVVQERAVALVGLGDEDVAGAVVRVGAGLAEVAADGERRVDAAVLQRDGEHRGRRGLAVGAGDGDRPRARPSATASASARCSTRSPRRWASTSSRLVVADGGRHHDRVGAGRRAPRRARRATSAPSARSAPASRESLASLPRHRHARGPA